MSQKQSTSNTDDLLDQTALDALLSGVASDDTQPNRSDEVSQSDLDALLGAMGADTQLYRPEDEFSDEVSEITANDLAGAIQEEPPSSEQLLNQADLDALLGGSNEVVAKPEEAVNQGGFDEFSDDLPDLTELELSAAIISQDPNKPLDPMMDQGDLDALLNELTQDPKAYANPDSEFLPAEKAITQDDLDALLQSLTDDPQKIINPPLPDDTAALVADVLNTSDMGISDQNVSDQELENLESVALAEADQDDFSFESVINISDDELERILSGENLGSFDPLSANDTEVPLHELKDEIPDVTTEELENLPNENKLYQGDDFSTLELASLLELQNPNLIEEPQPNESELAEVMPEIKPDELENLPNEKDLILKRQQENLKLHQQLESKSPIPILEWGDLTPELTSSYIEKTEPQNPQIFTLEELQAHKEITAPPPPPKPTREEIAAAKEKAEKEAKEEADALMRGGKPTQSEIDSLDAIFSESTDQTATTATVPADPGYTDTEIENVTDDEMAAMMAAMEGFGDEAPPTSETPMPELDFDSLDLPEDPIPAEDELPDMDNIVIPDIGEMDEMVDIPVSAQGEITGADLVNLMSDPPEIEAVATVDLELENEILQLDNDAPAMPDNFDEIPDSDADAEMPPDVDLDTDVLNDKSTGTTEEIDDEDEKPSLFNKIFKRRERRDEVEFDDSETEESRPKRPPIIWGDFIPARWIGLSLFYISLIGTIGYSLVAQLCYLGIIPRDISRNLPIIQNTIIKMDLKDIKSEERALKNTIVDDNQRVYPSFNDPETEVSDIIQPEAAPAKTSSGNSQTALDIHAEQVLVDGAPIGVLVINDQLVLRIFNPGEFESPMLRTQNLVSMLLPVANQKPLIKKLVPKPAKDGVDILLDSQVIVKVNAADALKNQSTPMQLAVYWINNIRSALGVYELMGMPDTTTLEKSETETGPKKGMSPSEQAATPEFQTPGTVPSTPPKQEEIALAEEKRLKLLRKVVSVYEAMKPDVAASNFQNMPDDQVIEILQRMKERKMAKIIEVLPPDRAAKLIQKMSMEKP